MVSISATRFEQRGLVLYSGTISAGDLLSVYDIHRWKQDDLEGYQRERYEERVAEIAKYIEKATVPIIPPLLVSLRRRVDFQPLNGNGIGHFDLPKEKNIAWVIDGQHRIGGFEVFQTQLGRILSGAIAPAPGEVGKLETLLEFPLAALFLDAEESLSKVRLAMSQEFRGGIQVMDLERAFFLIVNDTARPLRPSARDMNAYQLVYKGFTLPFMEKRKWRVEGVELVQLLNAPLSPLAGLINVFGTRGLGRPVQLASFVSALEPLIKNQHFQDLDTKGEKGYYLLDFWRGMRARIANAFSDDKGTRDQYLVLKTVGVYALCHTANDILTWATDKDQNPRKALARYLDPLRTFDWNRRTSPLAALGGQQGVREAHKRLLAHLDSNGVEEAGATLQAMVARERK